MAYHVNDGSSLAMIDDASVDLAFSFDSLVHAEVDVIESYLAQLRQKLTADGIAFLHHSNFAALLESANASAPESGQVENRHWRAESVSGEIVSSIAARESMSVVSQERINWGGNALSDCITVLTPTSSRWERPQRDVDNPHFMVEAIVIATWAPLYTNGGVVDGPGSGNRGSGAKPPG